MLALLLDENISQVVAREILSKRPDMPVDSVHTWAGGRLRGTPDEQLLAEAANAGLTLVTYDLRTVPEQIRRAYEESRPLAGVILIDQRTIIPQDVGALVHVLVSLWDAHKHEEWTNRVEFLSGRG